MAIKTPDKYSNACLITSWAPYYRSPDRPSVEMRLTALAARILHYQKRIHHFYIFVNVQFPGMRQPECEMMKNMMLNLGVPEEAIHVFPSAVNTDAEIHDFFRQVNIDEVAIYGVRSLLTTEAKRGRIERILRDGEFPNPGCWGVDVFWVEDVCDSVPINFFPHCFSIFRIVRKWRGSPRYVWDRIFYGHLALLLMGLDSKGRIANFLCRRLRQKGAPVL